MIQNSPLVLLKTSTEFTVQFRGRIFKSLNEIESSLGEDVQSPDFLAQETEDAELSFPEGGMLRITVTGTRTPRSVEDLPATVTVF